jgi:hypothetical protein
MATGDFSGSYFLGARAAPEVPPISKNHIKTNGCSHIITIKLNKTSL